LKPDALAKSTDDTFIPPAEVTTDNSFEGLPSLEAGEQVGERVELQFTRVLGEGGQGQVRGARQLSLDREVAVKTVRQRKESHVTRDLLREARITGALEHPNVVPVYQLGRAPSGDVLLVMKRVDGEPWAEVLRQEPPMSSPRALERHLEILLQVCNAIEFAHSRNIVHRDIKPDNVMVGSFGEVVVLDWGVAVALSAPRRELLGLAGTPSYMAPELVSGIGSALGLWTDVYLLGAVLHEILTGEPPHRGGVLDEVLQRAYRSEPPVYGAQVPTELARLCQRAMARVVTARCASVHAFAQGVRDFLRHRESAVLADEAARRLAALVPFDTEAHVVLAQSRFGFEQALNSWPENPVAVAGVERIINAEVRQAAHEGNAPGARRSLEQLRKPSPELEGLVEALEKRLHDEQQSTARARRLTSEFDPTVTSPDRNRLLALTGAGWGTICVTLGLAQRLSWFTPSTELMFGITAVWLALTAGWAFWRRKTLLRNAISRRLLAVLVLAFASSSEARYLTHLLGLPAHAETPFVTLLYGVIGAIAAMIDLRFGIAAVVYFIGAAVAARWPDDGLIILGLTNALALIPMALAWHSLRFLARPPTATPHRVD